VKTRPTVLTDTWPPTLEDLGRAFELFIEPHSIGSIRVRPMDLSHMLETFGDFIDTVADPGPRCSGHLGDAHLVPDLPGTTPRAYLLGRPVPGEKPLEVVMRPRTPPTPWPFLG
jgi:hypothetical protein